MTASKPKVLVSIGTRPEAVKLAPVVHRLRADGWADVRVMATAQHRELLDRILRFFDVGIDVDLDMMRPGQRLADLTSRMVEAVDHTLTDERPDVVLAQGDTTTVMVTALCCNYQRIPFGHVEAGLRTGDRLSPFPEELNRSLVGRLADVHFAPTPGARDNLLREGIDADRIEVTGNTVIDALLWGCERVNAGKFSSAHGHRTILLTAHRRENFGQPLEEIFSAVRALVAERDVEVLYPVHPNPEVRRTAERLLAGDRRIRLVEPLDYPDFIAAMQAAHLILTDSGGVQEEAPALGKPVLVLRESTERPEGVAAGTARLVGHDRDRILAEALRLLDDTVAYGAMARATNPYGDGKAAPRTCHRLEDYLLGQE